MSTLFTELNCNKFGGIRQISSVFSSGLITASDVQNVELYDTGVNNGGGVRTMLGNSAIINFAPDEKIINIFESVQLSKKYTFVHTETSTEGRIYLWDRSNNTKTLLRDLLNPAGHSCGLDFAQGESDLFIFATPVEMLTIEMNADEQVKDFIPHDMDGAYINTYGMASYNSRLWLFSKNKLWYSVDSNIFDFATSAADEKTSSGYILYSKNITAIVPYIDSLAVFFADSSIIITGDFPYSQTQESPGGCVNQNAFVFQGTELYFFDFIKKGIYSFKQVVLGNKTLENSIAGEIQNELLNIDPDRIKELRAISVNLENRNEIWLLLPSNNDYTTILIYDCLHNEWIKRKSQKIYALCVLGGLLYSGGKGKIYQEYKGQDFDGNFIENYYYCAPFNLGSETSLKVLCFPPRIAVEGQNYCNSFYVRYIKNYDTSKRPKTKLIKSKFGRFLFWDLGFWDINFWASNILRFIKKLPSANFKTLEIQFFTANAAQDFCIKSIEFTKIKVKKI